MNYVEVKNIKKDYFINKNGKKEILAAVNDVSFEIAESEMFGIIGESGSGKSTIIKLLAGLTKPTSGEIKVDKPIGFVPQDPYASLCPTLCVEKIIAEPLLFHNQGKKIKDFTEEITQILELVNLDYETYRKKLPNELSGGERQRVAIARALVFKPNVLILDEPTSMLDHKVKLQLTDLLKHIIESHKGSILIVTHDIDMACQICNRIAVMRKGEFLEQDVTNEIMTNPKSEYTKKLILASKDIEKYWEEYGEK